MHRIRVKELKDFLKDLPDDLEVHLDVYTSAHRKEILFAREYEQNRSKDYEIVVAKVDKD